MNEISKINASTSNSISFSAKDFEYVSKLAKKKFGLNLSETKMPLVQSRISKRMRELKISDFACYRQLLESRINRNEETKLLSVLTTNVTSFFRENHHFDYMKEDIRLRIDQRGHLESPIRIWSAACSSGQEVYSITMSLAEVCSQHKFVRFQVLASDIDPLMVESAKMAKYSLEQLNCIPSNLSDRYTQRVDANVFKVDQRLVEKVEFKTINLIQLQKKTDFYDYIFCRNAAIYFDQETQSSLWDNLADALRVGGQLYIGHSERIHGRAKEKLQNCGITAYRRC
ncbi:MAG: protein-glutamate O-methyltransferase CheR [Pseudomonadota bacterium]